MNDYEETFAEEFADRAFDGVVPWHVWYNAAIESFEE